jgi:hypothetical protein
MQGLLHSLKALRMMGLVLHPQNGKELVATSLISQDATSKINRVHFPSLIFNFFYSITN